MANKDYKAPGNVRAGQFTPLAELAENIDYLDKEIPLGRTNFPSVDALKIGMACLCDEEFMQLIAITPTGVRVKRGAADTVPAQHGARSLIWFFDNTLVGTDGKEHVAGETNSVKYSPYTIGGGSFPIALSGIDTVTYRNRFFRPYPPGQMRVRGQRWWNPQIIASDNPNMKFTWAHRDRKTQADQLIDHDVTNIGPEPGTTYTARIFNSAGVLKRTITGIMAVVRNEQGVLLPPQWTYTWNEAMSDLEIGLPTEDEMLVDAHIEFCSTRQGYDSWQGYRIDFQVNVQGFFIKVSQFAEMSAQRPEPVNDPDTPPTFDMVFDGQLAQIVAQQPGAETPDTDVVGADGMFVSHLAQGAGQETNFYTPLNRNLWEAPYAFQALHGDGPEANMLITVAARPSDRLTDSHDVWTRYDWPAGSGAMFSYEKRSDPAWTPWATLKDAIAQLDTTITFDKTSFVDGVSLSDVVPGQIAQVDAEMFRVETVSETGITLARGCYDTIPAKHKAGARVWFFGAQYGRDPTDYPERIVNNVIGGAVQVKMRPSVYGPPLNLLDVPTDRLQTKSRSLRPYPPGQVLVNGQPWYKGALPTVGQPVNITWVHRNRTAQGAQVIDHLAADQGAETDQRYRLKISVWVTPEEGPSYEVKIREVVVDGTSFEYSYDMAKQDGYRAGAALGVCGRVTVGLQLAAIRYDLESWQWYVIPLGLPSYKCPPGQPPGGGQLPPGNGNGNGDPGNETPGGQTPGGDNTGDGPGDPIDNGGGNGGDDGTGPPDPPEVPPDWPDPVDPPDPDPNDPNPNLAAHWDLNWDRHWDAYTKDNTGD
jgi:hypothetical protein